MRYQVVEAYSTDTVEFQGQSLPAYCLVEDEDGIRLLLVPGHQPFSAAYWGAAHAQGAQAIVSRTPLSYVLAQDFMERREESDRTLVLNEPFWTMTSTLPRYVEMRLRHEEEQNNSKTVTGFVNLHTHTEYSPLDGLATMVEIAEVVTEYGQQAFGSSDHGTCAGHPDQQKTCTKYGLKAIFGIEAYFVNDRHNRPENQYDYWHLVLWAMNDEGLRNLWAMSTESYQDGYHGKPRIDWDTLERLGEGVLASSACLGGPLLQPWNAGRQEEAVNNLLRLKTIFGDRFYIELHANQMEEQIRGNRWLVQMAHEYEVPLIAVADSHYARPQEKQTHQDWLSVQIQKDVSETNLFQGGHDYHVMSEHDIRRALAYLPADIVETSITNTAVIANRCTAEIKPNLRNPIYSRATAERPDRIQHDVDRLIDICLGRWKERTEGKPHPPSVYMERFEKEMKLLISKGFCGYFLIVWDLVSYAKRIGILVGPGRGSGGGSLVAYLSGITEIDPIENDLLFERFMTEGRVELPDFDIDFPSSKKMVLFEYAAERWGQEHVAINGTHMRLKNKSAINGTMQALHDRLPEWVFADKKGISKVIDEAEAHTAGLGLSWDELWAQAGDLLEPYREKYPQLFEVAGSFRGRLRGYGKHPAGIIIDPDHPLTGSLPLRGGEDGVGMITQFDLDALAELGYVKFDLLNISNLDTIQACVDLIEEQTGRRVVPYEWRDEYLDPYIYEEMGEGWTLGIFQIGTSAGTREVKRFKPRRISELADVITLVRPGPKRSGLTETYFRRHIGDEEVVYSDERLKLVLEKTYGTMLYQEDILAVCMVLAGYDSNEADGVRKILGKKKIELVREAGEKFVSRAIENNTDPAVAAAIWDQMAEFAKYCVTGDTKVHLAASGPSSDGTVTVSELYRRIHSQLPAYAHAGVSAGAVGRPPSTFDGPCVCCGDYAKSYVRGYCANRCNAWLQKFRTKGLYALSYYADERIRPARILDVVHNGTREVWRITLEDGKTITATSNHRHRTPGGYREVLALEVGHELIVDDGYEISTPQESSRRGRLTTGVRRRSGAVNGCFGDSNYGYIDGGSAVWELWKKTHPRVCKQCGEVNNVQLAHLDGNHQNNVESNFVWLCHSCHLKYDYARNDRTRRWEKGHRAKAVRIVSKEYVGVEPVYDVVMEAPHNFVANGIVTHNSFNRAHACAYAIVGYWTAWLKFHYPIQFLCSALSTVDSDRIPDFVAEARRMGYGVLPPDINISHRGFTAHGMNVRYGLLAVDGVGEVAVDAILSTRPYRSWEHFLEVKTGKCNMGHVKALVRIGAFDSIQPNRRALESMIAFDAQPATDKCRFKDPEVLRFNLPCTFDWDNEPPTLGRTGKPLKQKEPPKKCTKACRRYSPIEPPDPTTVEPYTAADIRDIEHAALGVYLSSTPFDRIPAEDKETLSTAIDVLSGQNGSYTLAAIIRSKRGIISTTNKSMGFLTLTTERGELDVVVFNDWWEKYNAQFQAGRLCLFAIRKNDRGHSLDGFLSVDE
jgi:DNA polymerase-3 subunit alpha